MLKFYADSTTKSLETGMCDERMSTMYNFKYSPRIGQWSRQARRGAHLPRGAPVEPPARKIIGITG
jgi:hypothetical protein